MGGGEGSCCFVLVVAADALGCGDVWWGEGVVMEVAKASVFLAAGRSECSGSLGAGGCGS